MATSTIPIPKNTWTLVSTVSVKAQVQGQSGLYVIESVAPPAANDLTVRKTFAPAKMYEFEKVDGDFYAYSKDIDNVISIEPLV